jgi:succinyl-diaminopimelate desuccinylase
MTYPVPPAPTGESSENVRLDLSTDVVTLTRTLCDIPSVSGDERIIADAVEAALRGCEHLEVLRDGDAVVARTALGRPERVVIAGHLDTVPIAGNLPTWVEGEGADALIYGRGTTDMKSGVAVQLRLAATVPEPVRDVSYVFYDAEEVEAVRNGLGRLARTHPDWLAGDFAVLCEPSVARVEGGCQGTMRVDVDREGMNAVGISGGIAGNVIPDRCVVTVNYRFAPDRSVAQAEAHLRELFDGYSVTVTDASPGARPGLGHPAAASFVAAVGGTPGPKYGWTDVARFSELGIPAVNYGPGDPQLAHRDNEHCPAGQIVACEQALRRWLTSA